MCASVYSDVSNQCGVQGARERDHMRIRTMKRQKRKITKERCQWIGWSVKEMEPKMWLNTLYDRMDMCYDLWIGRNGRMRERSRMKWNGEIDHFCVNWSLCECACVWLRMNNNKCEADEHTPSTSLCSCLYAMQRYSQMFDRWIPLNALLTITL